jgi:hypothetical protein
LRERNNQVITPVGRCSEKGRVKKTIGSNGLTKRNNQVLTPTEDAVKRKRAVSNSVDDLIENQNDLVRSIPAVVVSGSSVLRRVRSKREKIRFF